MIILNKAVIFDLDGTLWQTLDSTWKSINEIAKKHNYHEISKDLVFSNFGNNKVDCARSFYPDLKEEDAFKMIDESDALNVLNLTKNGGNIYHNLENVLLILKKKYKLCIVSNTATKKYIEAFLISSGLSNYFDDYIAASALNISKGDAIRKIMNDNNIKNAVYVGDTIKDYEAAKIANIPFIQCLYGFGKDINCTHKINNLLELSNQVELVFNEI